MREAYGQDIDAIDESRLWVVGRDGFMLHNDGRQWLIRNLPDPLTITSLSLSEDGNGWAIVDGSWAGSRGDILTLSNDVWKSDERMDAQLREELNYLSLTSIHTVSETDAWAVGIDSNILHFDNSLWRYDRRFGNVDGWVTDTLWQMQDVDVVVNPDGNNNVWVVGDSETILRKEYRDGEISNGPTATADTNITPPPERPDVIYLPYGGRN